jgi:hypothetical protein
MMLRSIKLFIFLLLSIAFVQAQQFPLSFSSSLCDLGTVPKGILKNTVIQVTNISDAPVGIYQFNSLSGFVSARARKTVLQPGEKTDLHIQFHAGAAQGNFESKIVMTLIGDKRSAEIIVRAIIGAPPVLGVGKLKPDTTGVPVIRLK